MGVSRVRVFSHLHLSIPQIYDRIDYTQTETPLHQIEEEYTLLNSRCALPSRVVSLRVRQETLKFHL